jgi:acid stress-induced BolA-like protein IbaG/YrbA
VQTEKIKSIIEHGLLDSLVILDGDGIHFQSIVVSDKFEDKNMLERHRRAYRTSGDKMGKVVHALFIRTLTLYEWNKEKVLGKPV